MRRPSRSSFLPSALVAFTALSCLALGSPLRAAAEPGIALAVVFDTSGSMKDPVAKSAGATRDAKSLIAQRAFRTVIDRLETFTQSPAATPPSVGVAIFKRQNAQVVIPLAKFDARTLRLWLSHASFDASTPLGDAMYLAGKSLLASSAASRHLLVLTDGANTDGRKPADALAQINLAAERKNIAVFTHIIALDIAPTTFAALKKQGRHPHRRRRRGSAQRPV